MKVTDDILNRLLSCRLPVRIFKLLQQISHSVIFSLIAEYLESCCDVSIGSVNQSTHRNVPHPLAADLSKLFDLQLKLAPSLKQPRARSG